jgi:hypothetical protein
MANVKYRVKEFTPTANQSGTHSFYAEAVVDNVIDNKALAKKIEARGISRAAEIKSILEEAANIILEECAENNRVQLESGEGVLISIYPRCKGSVSDADVLADPETYNNAQAATEEFLTADKLTWSLGATVGVKFSKQFALNKTAQRVEYNPAQTTAEPEENTGGNNGGGNHGNNEEIG